MRIARTERFRKAYRQLPEEQKALARKAIDLLAENMRYPGLRVKRIQGTEGLWEARVGRSCRLTFEIQGDVIVLRNIGEHDSTLDRP